MKSISTILLICLTATLGFGCGSKPETEEEGGDTPVSGGAIADGGADDGAADGNIEGTEGAIDGGVADGGSHTDAGTATTDNRLSIPANCTLDEVSTLRAISRNAQAVSMEIDPSGYFVSINGQSCDRNVTFTDASVCRAVVSCGGQLHEYFAERPQGRDPVWVLMDGGVRWELGAFTGTFPIAATAGGTSTGGTGTTGGTGNSGGATSGVCGTSEDARGWTSLIAGTYLWSGSRDSAVMLRSDCSYCQASQMDDDDLTNGTYRLAIDGTWEILDHITESDGEVYTRIRFTNPLNSFVYRVWEVHIQQAIDSDVIWNTTTTTWTLRDANPGEVGPVALGIPRLVKQDSNYSTSGDPAFVRSSSNGNSMPGYECSAGGDL